MQPLVLTRQVQLRKFEALLEIGRQERREELHAVLMIASHRGTVTPGDICDELLIERPESVGKAIIERCQDFGLLDQSGILTDVGCEALQTSMVFVPERGRYIMWYTEDPLIPQRLLHLEAEDESPVPNEIEASKNRSNSKEPKEIAEDLSKLRTLEEKTYSLMGSGGRVHIRKIESIGITRELDKNDSLKVELHIPPVGRLHLRVIGRFV